MGKRIAIFIDGTSDFAAERPTHVFRLFQEAERSDDQVSYYDGGVGTLRDTGALTTIKKRILQSIDLAVASRIDRSFTEAYKFLVRNYENGDSIYLFGFSRGAYTVRALAGAIHMFGILHREHENIIPYVWQTYRSFGDNKDNSDRWDDVRRIKSAFSGPAEVEYLGAWDTVSSVGFIRFVSLPQTSKLSAVKNVRHAMAIDEKRNLFPPNRISGASPTHHECWFSGVHRDVGGGGHAESLPLSMPPYHWVVDGAKQAGLTLTPSRSIEPVEENACAKDNGSMLIVLCYALTALIPLRSWSRKQNRFVWKWLTNWIWTREISPDDYVHPSVKVRMNCTNLRYKPPNLDPLHVMFRDPCEASTSLGERP